MTFSAWLAERRREAGINQRELAKKCSLSPAYVAALERGTSEPPPFKTCKNLARALDLNWEEVWHHSFASRLKRWLKREGYSKVSEAELAEIVDKLESANR